MSESENALPDGEVQDPATGLTEEVPMNREQRRAAAKGKKSGSSGTSVFGSGIGSRGGGNRGPTPAIQQKFPRSGHK